MIKLSLDLRGESAGGDRLASSMSKCSVSVNSDLGKYYFWIKSVMLSMLIDVGVDRHGFDCINWPLTSKLRQLRTKYFSWKCGDFFLLKSSYIICWLQAQKIMWGIWMKYCTRVGSNMGTQTKKAAEKTSLFFSSKGKKHDELMLSSGFFFSLAVGSTVR